MLTKCVKIAEGQRIKYTAGRLQPPKNEIVNTWMKEWTVDFFYINLIAYYV